MSGSPTISIVTACYNSMPFIDRLYGSLKAQAYKNFEWICVDDCSTDDTVERLLALEAPGELGMKVYRLPINSGGSVPLVVGIEKSQGDSIVILDHDDEFLPFALELIREHWPAVQRVRTQFALRGPTTTTSSNTRRAL